MAENSWIRIGAVDAHLDARTVNSIIEKVLGKRAVSITQRPELRQAIGEKFVEAVKPFVPYKSGDLSNSGRATDDGRVYWTSVHRGYNYASRLYDEDGELWGPSGYINPTLGKYPGTDHDPQPRWVTRVHPGTAEWESFINNITPTIKEAFAKDE